MRWENILKESDWMSDYGSLSGMRQDQVLVSKLTNMAKEITNIVIANEDPPNWLPKAGRYAAEPTDRDHERVKKVQDVA